MSNAAATLPRNPMVNWGVRLDLAASILATSATATASIETLGISFLEGLPSQVEIPIREALYTLCIMTFLIKAMPLSLRNNRSTAKVA
jgi:hypothetical protein